MSSEFFQYDAAPREALSGAGTARRDLMLRELDAAMRRRNFARTATRVSIAATPVIALACTIWLWTRGTTVPAIPHESANIANVAPAPAQSPYTLVQFVETDPTVMQRFAADPAPLRIQPLSDSELQSLLASLGKPTGLVRTGGRVILVNDLKPPPKNPESDSSTPDPLSSI